MSSDFIPPGADLYENNPLSSGPPEATIARRAKSYSDFYDAATSYLTKETKGAKSKDNVEALVFKSTPRTRGVRFERLEDDLLDASHEEFQYV